MYADSPDRSIDLDDASIELESKAERDREENVWPEVGYWLDSGGGCARMIANAFILRKALRKSLIVASSAC